MISALLMEDKVTGKTYIVWNESKSEGVVFVDDGSWHPIFGGARTAAESACNGTGNDNGSTLANAFAESYEEDDRTIQIIDTSVLLP